MNVALVTCYNELGQLLIGKRRDNNRYTITAGHIEPGEAPRDAALREVWEEAGLKCSSLSYLTTYTTSEGVNLYCYSAFVTGQPHGHLDPDNEVEKWEWCDVSSGLPPKIYNNLHGPKNVNDHLLKRIFDLKKAEDDLQKSEIERLLNHPDPSERTMALKLNPSPNDLFLASLDHNPLVWEAAIDHPNYNADLALKLVSNSHNSEYLHPSHQLEYILGKPYIDTRHLEQLYTNIESNKPDNYNSVLNKIGQRPDISPELWLKLYDNPDLSHENRLSLLNHTSIPEATLLDAIKNATKTEDLKTLEIGKKTLEHPIVSDGFIEKFVLNAVGSNSIPLITLAAHALASRTVSTDLIDTLQNQARSHFEPEHAKLRLAAINGPGAKPEHLDRALEDHSAFVRDGVPYSPNAKPWHINRSIDRAIKDKNRDGIKNLLNHPAVGRKQLTGMIKHESNDVADSKVANVMLGIGLDDTALKAARLMVGHAIDESLFRQFLIEYDGDGDSAALKCAGFEVNDKNLKALRALKGFQALNKAEGSPIPQPESIEPALPDGAEVAEALKRAFKDQFVFEIQLAGKHSKGALVARDEKTQKSYLLKPGSGHLSSAAGLDECNATQSVREAAFYAVASFMGLGKWYPKTDLILMDHRDIAVMELLPWSYETFEHRKKEDLNIAQKAFGPLINNGVLFQLAVCDYVLGNTDRHGNNCLIDEDSEVRLIDHGSTFAGHSFDPANDLNSFIPAYLRAFSSENFRSLSVIDRMRVMPKAGPVVDEELLLWLNSIDLHIVANIIQKFGIDPEPEIARLIELKEMAQVMGVSRAIGDLWAVT